MAKIVVCGTKIVTDAGGGVVVGALEMFTLGLREQPALTSGVSQMPRSTAMTPSGSRIIVGDSRVTPPYFRIFDWNNIDKRYVELSNPINYTVITGYLPRTCAMSANGEFIYVYDYAQGAFRWSNVTHKYEPVTLTNTAPYMGMASAFSADGQLFFLGGSSQPTYVQKWDGAGGFSALTSLTPTNALRILASADTSRIVILTSNSAASGVNLLRGYTRTGDTFTQMLSGGFDQLPTHSLATEYIRAGAMSPDGEFVVLSAGTTVVGENIFTYRWNSVSGRYEKLPTPDFMLTTPQDMVFSTNGEALYVSSADEPYLTAAQWSAEQGRFVKNNNVLFDTLPPPAGGVGDSKSLELTTDGKRLVVTSMSAPFFMTYLK